MDPSFFCQSICKYRCSSSIPNCFYSCNLTFINSNYYQRVTTGTYSSINCKSICPHSNIFYSCFFFDTADAIQVPNMHLVAPKVTLVAFATIGFLSSNPFANGSTLGFATVSITIQVAKVVVFSLMVPLTFVSSSL